MTARRFAIHKHLGLLKRALELQRHPLARPRRRNLEVLPIPARANIEFVRKKIRQAERMRQADRAQEASLKPGASAPGTSSRIKLHSRLKLTVARKAGVFAAAPAAFAAATVTARAAISKSARRDHRWSS